MSHSFLPNFPLFFIKTGKKMRVSVCLDTIFIPLSLLITLSYHLYLCHTIKNNPSRTTYGIDKLKRTTWTLNLNQVKLFIILLDYNVCKIWLAYIYVCVGWCQQGYVDSAKLEEHSYVYNTDSYYNHSDKLGFGSFEQQQLQC